MLGATPQGQDKTIETLLGDVLTWDFTLELPALRRGFSHVGSGSGLRRVVAKMIQGHSHTKITVVGGSFSRGHDAIFDVNDYVTLLKQYVSKAFRNTSAHNGAVGGSGSQYMSQCLRASASPDTDLMLLEYMLNDPVDDRSNRIVDNPNVKSYERLIRHAKVLRGYPSSDINMTTQVSQAIALMMVHAGAYGMWNTGPQVKAAKFNHIMEDVDNSLALYYDIPVVSMRGAAGSGPYADYFWSTTFPTRSHPTEMGHKFTADLVIFALQETAVGLLLSPEIPLSEPSFVPPMIEGNEISSSITCAPFEALKHIVSRSSGFEFRNEKGKGGFIGTKVNDSITFRVNTELKDHELDLGVGSPLTNSTLVYIGIAFLTSYEHMGRAIISCSGGCVCASVTIDALHQHHSSITDSTRLGPVSRSSNCTVEARIVQSVPPRIDNKFKVLAIIVSKNGLMTGGIGHYDSISFSTKDSHSPPGRKLQTSTRFST